MSLNTYYSHEYPIEIGIDEAGRGPMFGRLYVAAAVLPKDDSFRHELVKDSKKFHSVKKIREVAEYIKTHSVAWTVQYVEPVVIDEINIRQAVFRGMHDCCRQIMTTHAESYRYDTTLCLVDGNDFAPIRMFDEITETMIEMPHVTIEGGDNKYTAIAAASILAKVARDTYIDELCDDFPELDAKYDLRKNKGYGTKRHMDGIREHGITSLHRRTFGLCKEMPITQTYPSESCSI